MSKINKLKYGGNWYKNQEEERYKNAKFFFDFNYYVLDYYSVEAAQFVFMKK